MGETVDRWLEEAFEERWRSFAGDGGNGAPERRHPEAAVEPVLEEKEREEPLDLAVVERDLPDGLFGFTRRDSSHVVVSRNLYRVDRERTVRHEKTHHLFPDDEMTIRYINGDPDVRTTLSFNGNNPGRLGNGSRGVSRTGAAAYSSRSGGERYTTERADAYL